MNRLPIAISQEARQTGIEMMHRPVIEFPADLDHIGLRRRTQNDRKVLPNIDVHFAAVHVSPHTTNHFEPGSEAAKRRLPGSRATPQDNYTQSVTVDHGWRDSSDTNRGKRIVIPGKGTRTERSNAMPARRFDPQPHFVSAARAFAREVSQGSQRAEDIELVASELATNAIRHAMTPFEMSIHIGSQQIRLEVTDASPAPPILNEASRSRHGLHIVSALAERWGVDAVDGGKTVWAEFTTE
jgi:Histidine kinase-like ATPase domain